VNAVERHMASSSQVGKTANVVSHEMWRKLTPRQADVLRGVVRGDSNAKIARRLRIKEQTVKNHVSVLIQLLHVCNRVQLAVLAAREWPHVSAGDE
jgi:two-component system nitrate/nitrite response regulator NarL